VTAEGSFNHHALVTVQGQPLLIVFVDKDRKTACSNDVTMNLPRNKQLAK